VSIIYSGLYEKRFRIDSCFFADVEQLKVDSFAKSPIFAFFSNLNLELFALPSI
jgi:hypothetical protein